MKTNRERGNALIYVLIAIALFAALSMTLGRQTNTNEASDLSDDKAELYATQMISYAAQVKSAADQMIFSGMDIGDFEFTRPGEAGFDGGTKADKIKRVYHPDGGGLSVGEFPPEVVAHSGTDPYAGWYLGRFNNIDWTKTAATDVLLTAYGIHKRVCEKINAHVIGSAAVPTLADSAAETMVDDAYHVSINADLATDPSGAPACAACYKRSSLCVFNPGDNVYVFYTVIADR